VNTREGAAVYSPALDAVICGGGDSTNDLIRVNSNTSIAEIAAAPAPVGAWTSATTNRSVLTVHPTSGKPMILGREADSGTVWIYESASNTWATQAYTHPFDTGTVDNLWTACRVRLYGAMAALKQKSDKTCDMVLWRKLT
jgi:hypothetical protein